MPKKILIADDEEDLVEIMKCLLTDAGYEVATACDGKDCLRVLRKVKPHLIIMDILMPKMTGYEVIKKIKGMDAVKNIPIIVTTARKDMKDFLNSWEVADFIFKPFEPDDLIAKVKKVLPFSDQPEKGGKAEASGAELPCGRKKAVIAACGDFITFKIKAALQKHGYDVVVTVDNEKVIKEIDKYYPIQLIVCEMSDATAINARMISEHLHEKFPDSFFLVFCTENLAGKALKDFQPSQIIVYDNGDELVGKFEGCLKEIIRKAA